MTPTVEELARRVAARFAFEVTDPCAIDQDAIGAIALAVRAVLKHNGDLAAAMKDLEGK